MSRIALALSFLLTLACVPKAKYMALEDQLGACQRKVEQQQQLAEATRQRLLELKKDLQPLVDRGILEVTVDEGRIVVGMAADVLFASGSAELSNDGRQAVVEVAHVLTRRTDREFQVEGHTDDVPISSAEFPTNWHLGATRAINVLQVMIKAGMPADRISAATYGDSRPVGTNDSPAGRAHNRRIEVVLLPDLSELPGYDSLMENGRPARHKKPAKDKQQKGR